MTQSLLDFLTEQHVDSDGIQQAARLYLAERTDDLTKREMRQQLDQATGDARLIDTLMKKLEQDSAAVENGALVLLSWAWEEPGERERVIRAIEQAKAKLPVIEVTLIVIATMYGMYLIATGGKKKVTTWVKRREDGKLEESRETIEYAGFPEVISAMVKLFNKVPSKGDKS